MELLGGQYWLHTVACDPVNRECMNVVVYLGCEGIERVTCK